jgi:tetratricopeptide (TPR) repeat protein
MSYHRSSCAQCVYDQVAEVIYGRDATAIDEQIESLLQAIQGLGDADYVLGLVDELAARDPKNALIPQYRAILYSRRAELTDSSIRTQDFDKAVAAARAAIEAYPTNPSRHLFLADLLEKRAANSENAADRKQFNSAAAVELQTALDLESKRIYVSPLHRIDEARRRGLKKRIEHLKVGV